MRDEHKTKRQLIDELTQLRQQLSQERCQLSQERCRVDELEARDQDNAMRQQVESVLQTSLEQWYTTTFNTMSDAICLLDSQSRIQRCNRAMVELVDRPLGEILGRHCWKVVHGTSEPIDECPVVRMWATLSRESLAVPLGDRWFDVFVDPLLTDDGQSIGAVHVMTDITERKRAEDELRASEARFRTFVDHAADAFLLSDEWGTILDVNRQACESLGYSREEMVGMTVFDFDPSIDRSIDGQIKARLDAGEVVVFDTWSRRKDGSVFPVEVRVRPFWQDERRLSVSLIRDITERKQAQDALRLSEEKLRLALEGAVADSWEMDLAAGTLTFGDHWAVHMGYEPGEIAHTMEAVQGVVHPDDLQRTFDDLDAYVKGETSLYETECRLRRKDGDYVWIVSRGRAVAHDQDGRPTRLIGTNFDITERKQAERVLQQSNDLLRAIIEAAPTAIIGLDLDGNVQTVWNPAAEKVLGWSAQEVMGHPLPSVPEESWEEFRGFRERIRSGKTIDGVEVRRQRRDGSPIDYSIYASPLHDAEGQITGNVAVLADITERKRAERERLAHLWFFESMDQVNRAMQGTNDLEQMMSDVLDVVLSIFETDRAFLGYPCDPQAPSWRIPVERTRPEYPGAAAIKVEVPMSKDDANLNRALLASSGPVKFGHGPDFDHPLPVELMEDFGIQSQIIMAIYPRVGKPWTFGIHQCSHPRIWTPEEDHLLKEIGRRIADGLTSVLMYRNLKERENKYRELADSITDVFFAMDTDLKYTYWNRASENLIGIKAEDAIGKTIFEVFPDTKETRKAAAVYQDVLKKKQAKSFEMEYRLKDKRRFFDINVYLTVDGIAVFAKDITERKRVEEALTRQAEQLRLLSTRLAEVQEAERRRMARELHDQVGQNLTALSINLNTLGSHLAQAPEEAQACLNDSLGLVKQTTGRIRGVMADLRPPELDDYGLLSALRWYAGHIGARTGLAIAVKGEVVHPRLSSQQETALFRIAQEALTNVVKHAQATQATVTLEASEEQVRMIIADDGVGFDPASLEVTGETSHWGLLTMKERARAIEARWRVESSLGGGTRVVVEMARPRGGE